jgi:hypothetical protein
MLQRVLFTISLALCVAASPVAQDRVLVGSWKAVTYEINGVAYPMRGLFIFTKNYYSANIRFKMGNGPVDNANGNAGPYTRDGSRIVFMQWVQIHVRPDDKNEPVVSREGPDEAADYRVEGDRLTLIFPSGNRYILERVAE